MGWAAGTGLGTKRQGIATPIQANVRPRGMGLAFEGFKEKAAQATEDEERRRKGSKKGKAGFGDDAAAEGVPKRDEVWKKRDKPRKSKVLHRTFEDIVAEIGDAAPDIGLVTDLSGQAVCRPFCWTY
jgi:tuftelin-interacting protein 11